MTDAKTLRLLAFVHPAWMVASLALALATARLGIEIRRRRTKGLPVGAGLRGRHLRLGRLAVPLVAAGALLGPVSMACLRGRPIFDSFHGVLGLVVAGLFLWTGHSGRSLAKGDQDARGLHRLVAAAAIGAALLEAVAGFVLLP
ncbi:MAG: DUF4079 family protein [Myxococcota bacterium]